MAHSGNFLAYLRSKMRKPNGNYSHTQIPNCAAGKYGGSYYISDSEYDTFLDKYHKYVFEQNNECYLTERHIDIAPILIDLDFRFTGELKRRYDGDWIKKFVKIYMEEASRFLKLPTTTDIFILEKDTPIQDKKVVKDGIHIIIPSVVTEPKVQFLIRSRMIKNKECNELIGSLSCTNDINDVIDLCVIERNNWQFYGSMKPNNIPYKVSMVLKRNNPNNLFADVDVSQFTSMDFLKLFSIRNKKVTTEFKSGQSAVVLTLYRDLEQQFKTNKRSKPIVRARKKSPNRLNGNFIENVKHIQELVEILNPKRADNYKQWIELGWCLHNIDDRLLETWIKFSKKSKKYKIGECEDEWKTMDNEGLGMGTLYNWAKNDNKVKYDQMVSNDLRYLLYQSLTKTHTDVAKVMYKLFRNKFVYSKKIWYHFKNHRWQKMDNGVEVKNKMSCEMVQEYNKLRMSFIKKQNSILENGGSDTDKEYSDNEETIKKISGLINDLKKVNYKKNLLDECADMFYLEDFEENLDSNMMLIGFNNGVYDLEKGIFRDGIPEDNISYSTKINYEEYMEDELYITEVRTFIQQVIPNRELREYVLTLMSSFLDGKIKGEKFHIWTGSGGNGKSKLIELFQHCFGDYCCTIPSSLITEKRARAEACNPALVRTKGKRFACLQEPEGNERINVGLMKELTGGDKIQARGLHKDPIEFKPQFKLVLTCNDLPHVPSNDDGTWRRIRCVKFISKFTHNPNPQNAFEFPIDESLSDKLPEWCGAFMSILINYYNNVYKKKGLYEPDSVKEESLKYKNSNDPFSQFFNERMQKVESQEIIKLDEAYSEFKIWFSNTFSSLKMKSKPDFRENMRKRFSYEGNNFVGVVWKDIY